jgi:GSH-dependent disulfide-bond oxidoreductase
MIDLYSANTTNGQRAAIVLAESGLPYTLHKIDTRSGGARTEEFKKINPHARIPAIVDSDGPGGKPFSLAQSWAIVLYIAEKSGKLMPKEPGKRAVAMQWLFHIASDIQAMRPNQHMLKVAGESSGAVSEWFDSRQLELFQDVDKRLADHEYLAGELSIADFALWTLYDRQREMVEKHKLANVVRWGKALDARPAMKKALESLK